MRTKIRRKILVFSFISSILATLLLVAAFLLIAAIPSYNDSKDINLVALSSIDCKDNVCDISEYLNDWDIAYGPDYLLTSENFFISSTGLYPGFSLNYADIGLFENFREPTTWNAPDGVIWRLYSTKKEVNQKEVEVIVGWIEYTPSLLAETPSSPEIDEALISEADKIASKLGVEKERIILDTIKSNVDAFAVVDVQSQKIVDWGGSIPSYFPKDITKTPSTYIGDNNDFYLVRVDEVDGLKAISLAYIGNLKWLIVGMLLVFFTTFVTVYLASLTVLRKWFIFHGRRPIPLREALGKGEGQDVEFKRGLVEDDLLKSITAFANTNDGTVFIGVDDKARVKGINIGTARAKERFINKIFSLVRSKITPSIHLSVSFENLRSYRVVKLFIPRGEEPLYYLEGSIYVRHGDADVKAKPELVKKVLSEYSF